MRGEALPADVSGDLNALINPTKHYADDEYPGGKLPAQSGHDDHSKKYSFPAALVMAGPLYLWNFAPHPFKPGPGESRNKWLIDVPFFLFLLVLELIGALIKPFALCMRLFANMVGPGTWFLAVLITA